MTQLKKFLEWCKRGGLSTVKTGGGSFRDTRTQNAWNGWIAAMNQKVTDYTVIYIDSFMKGSHMHSYTKMKRVSLQENESLDKCLEREGLKESAVYVFEGHPKLKDE